MVARNCCAQARLRALGTVVAIECIDKLLPLDSSRPEGTVTDDIAKAVLRVVGCAIVAKRGLHPNVELLLRRVHERLVQLDVSVNHPEDIKKLGWGRDGFDDVDDLQVMLREFQLLQGHDPMHAGLVFQVCAPPPVPCV